jgi:hypothetical protein
MSMELIIALKEFNSHRGVKGIMALKQKVTNQKRAVVKGKKFKVSKGSSKATASKVTASNSLNVSEIVNAAATAGKAKEKSKSAVLAIREMREGHKKDQEMISFAKQQTEKTQSLLDKLDLL